MNYRDCKNQISYKGYCALGGASNPLLFTRVMRNGSYTYTTYWYMGAGL